ncbi:hypothetical protein CYMTET_22898 [Cymbomonas tetramitiformis]|uniref:GPI ethanolamine phosphate transferase 3 n=1 Tax=Cymbomonas tetramitiformis TaxID=36881 RepID=A0AAE0L1R7_9CHLO|nr:hypothetical protein CYMTET_22898 [Cymbomonas tetramitiformis]
MLLFLFAFADLHGRLSCVDWRSISICFDSPAQQFAMTLELTQDSLRELIEANVLSGIQAKQVWDFLEARHLAFASDSLHDLRGDGAAEDSLLHAVTQLVSLVTVLYSLGSLVITGVFIALIFLIQGHQTPGGGGATTKEPTEAQKRSAAGLTVTLCAGYFMLFARLGDALYFAESRKGIAFSPAHLEEYDPLRGERIVGGTLHLIATLAVPLGVYGVLRQLGHSVYTPVLAWLKVVNSPKAKYSALTAYREMPASVHLACFSIEFSCLFISALLYFRSGFPPLLGPLFISLYFMVISVTSLFVKLATGQREQEPWQMPPEVFATILFGVATLMFSHALAGHQACQLALLMSSMNTLVWSMPWALLEFALPSLRSRITDWANGTNKAAIDFHEDGRFYLVALAYFGIQLGLLSYSLCLRSWVCVPYGLAGILLLCVLAPGQNDANCRWALTISLPAGLYLLYIFQAFQAVTDNSWLAMLAWVGSKHTMSSLFLNLLRLGIAITAVVCINHGVRNIGIKPMWPMWWLTCVLCSVMAEQEVSLLLVVMWHTACVVHYMMAVVSLLDGTYESLWKQKLEITNPAGAMHYIVYCVFALRLMVLASSPRYNLLASFCAAMSVLHLQIRLYQTKDSKHPESIRLLLAGLMSFATVIIGSVYGNVSITVFGVIGVYLLILVLLLKASDNMYLMAGAITAVGFGTIYLVCGLGEATAIRAGFQWSTGISL